MPVAPETVFDCRMCGHCCEGRGGIVVSPTDLARLAAHMGQSPESVVERYCYHVGGKLKIRSGSDGYQARRTGAGLRRTRGQIQPYVVRGLFFAATLKIPRAFPWPRSSAPASARKPGTPTLPRPGATICCKMACRLNTAVAKPTPCPQVSHATPHPPDIAQGMLRHSQT